MPVVSGRERLVPGEIAAISEAVASSLSGRNGHHRSGAPDRQHGDRQSLSRLILHWGKLKSVRDNAAAMIGVAEEHGSFGAWLADWPGTSIVELWEALAKRFSQMGGNSGPSFLRMVGKDTFILTHSVTAALKRWGAADTPPKNRKDRAAVQSHFNAWATETSRSLCQLSLILAASVED